MQKNSNRKGLSLGAIFALVASAFVGVMPAQAAATDGANIAVRPAQGTTFVGTLLEDFPIYAQSLPGNANSNSNFVGQLMWKVERTSGHDMDVVFSTSEAVQAMTATGSATTARSGGISASAVADSATTSALVGGSTHVAFLNFRVSSASGVASWSPVTLTVTTWIDEVNGALDELDPDEWRTTQTITLLHPTALATGATIGALSALDTLVTVSANALVNASNLSGKFFWHVTSSAGVFDASDITAAGTDTTASSTLVGGAALTALGNVVSLSFVATPFSASQTLSAALRYDESGTGTPSSTLGYATSNVATATVAAVGASSLLIDSVVSDDVISQSATAYDVRPNKTYTVRILAKSSSDSVSTTVNVTLGGSALATGSKEISVNGGALRGSYPAEFAVVTGTDGYATVTIRTSGFVAGENFTVDASIGNNVNADQVTYTARLASYTVASDFANYLTTPGTATTIPFSVKDQWDVSSDRADQYLKVTRGGTGFAYATTVSYVPVVAGVANVAFTPEAATKTGSATVRVDIVRLDSGAWSADGSSNTSVTVNVSSVANAFSTGLAASRSASVSYFPSTVSWTTVNGSVSNAGSVVAVSAAADLVFRVSADVPATTSGAVSVRAGAAGAYSFQVASLKTGTFTMTLTNGTATTTSLLVVDPVADTAGVSIVFDTTQIEAGKTRIVTGQVLDANGNGVDTTGGNATIAVTFAGNAGIPVGSMPQETDADGKFQVSVLTSATDAGTFTLTATYLKSGASTATADRISVVQPITVGAAASTPTSDQKLTVGSFKGYVAIYTLGYTGQRLSAKVAGKWLVENNLTRFDRVVRNTGAGYTIKVDLYIDGTFVRSETVVTK